MLLTDVHCVIICHCDPRRVFYGKYLFVIPLEKIHILLPACSHLLTLYFSFFHLFVQNQDVSINVVVLVKSTSAASGLVGLACNLKMSISEFYLH